MTATTTAPGTFRGKTADEWRATMRRHHSDAADSFERCDTDGFLSQWASGVNAAHAETCAELADANGRATFPALFDLNGNHVPARQVPTRYGVSWRTETGWHNPSEAKSGARRHAADTRKGLVMGTIECDAWVIKTGQSINVWSVIVPAREPGQIVIIDNGSDRTRYEDR